VLSVVILNVVAPIFCSFFVFLICLSKDNCLNGRTPKKNGVNSSVKDDSMQLQLKCWSCDFCTNERCTAATVRVGVTLLCYGTL
jgi:hypothetical protein